MIVRITRVKVGNRQAPYAESKRKPQLRELGLFAFGGVIIVRFKTGPTAVDPITRDGIAALSLAGQESLSQAYPI